jgi:signal transduction histidine kinase
MPDQPVMCSTDLAKLSQVLVNLLANAVHYTETGRVTIGLGADGAFALLRVIDTGIGIAPEDLPHIFDRFWRVQRGRHDGGSGTGLGLSITRDLVHMLGATIEVRSEPGAGSTFTVRLPLVPVREPPAD